MRRACIMQRVASPCHYHLDRNISTATSVRLLCSQCRPVAAAIPLHAAGPKLFLDGLHRSA